MRPVLDPRLFPGLPKFLWFDDGSSDGSGGPGGDSGPGSAAGVGDSGPGGTSTSVGTTGAPAGTGAPGTGGAPAGVSSTGTGSFGGGMGGEAGPAGSATGTSVGMGPGTSTAGTSAAAANAAPGGAGGVSTGGVGGPGAATGGGGTGGPGAATGGGGGTAAGGSGFGAVRGMNPAVVNNIIAASLMGVPPGYATGVQTAVSPVTVSSLGPPSPRSSLSDIAQQVFGKGGAAAQQGGASTAAPAPNLFAPTLGGAAPGGTPNMGAPAAGLAHTPTGGYTSSLGAPTGSNVGQATINAPPTNPNVPAVGSHNANGGIGGGAGGIGSDAVAGGSSPNAPPGTPTDANTPGAAGGPDIMQVIANLLSGHGGPALSQLAATIFGAPPGYGVPGTNVFGNMPNKEMQNFVGVDPSSVLAPRVAPYSPYSPQPNPQGLAI